MRVRCPGPLGPRSPVCPLGVLCCMYGVMGHVAPVHRCAGSARCFACVVSWATWLLFTGVPARCVVLRVRCLGPLGSCSPVCPRGLLCCVCGVLGHLAPVHRCARSVCRAACAVFWATWLLFTGVLTLCVVLRLRCPGPIGSHSPVCPLGVLCCVCGVLGQVAPTTGKQTRRPDRDTDTKTRHQQTTTGHQTQHRTTAHNRKQHNAQQRTTAPGASNSTHHTNSTTRAHQHSEAQHRTQRRAQGTHSTHHRATTKHTQHRAHSAGEHRKTQRRKTQRRRAQGPRATGSARGQGATSSGTKRAQQSTRQHNAAQHRTQGRTAQHGTQHRAAGTKTARHKGGGGGAATTREQPKGRRKARKRDKRTESREAEGQQNKQRKRRGPGHPGAGNQRKPETTGAHGERRRGRKKKKKKTARPQAGATKPARHKGGGGAGVQPPKSSQRPSERAKRGASKAAGGREKQPTRNGNSSRREKGRPSPEGAKQSRKTKRPKEKVRRTRTRPGGRPARPGQEEHAHANTHGTRAWRPPTRKGKCRRPHETAPVHLPSPPSNDGRYAKPDASVTGSTRQPPQRTQPKTDAGGTRQGQPHRGAPNGYDAERAQRPCLGGGQRQAQ